MLSLTGIIFGAVVTLGASYSLGSLLLRRTSLPSCVAFAAGAAVLSHIVLIILLLGLASGGIFAALAAALILLGLVFGGRLEDQWPRWPAAIVILVVYGGFYLIHALAPEIRPDGYTYHLGLPREWLRLGGFSDRVGFFEMVPQGLEMLFTMAYAFGQHSAAKLVHFGFLVATVPMMMAVGRKLDLPDWASAAGAVLYVCSPVVGTAGTAAYNDAALVFFILAVFYLLFEWDQRRQTSLLLPLGLAAGFCYSIKLTGLVVAPLAMAWVMWRREWKAAAWLAAAAALMIAPWMVRNIVMSGNPVAPLFNHVFRNPHFHIWTEQYLGESLRSYGGVTWLNLPIELTLLGNKLQGLIGPVFLAAPLALLALRSKAGRWMLAAAALMAVPWVFNIGARFAMPALAFLALAFASVLPRKVALGLIILHAVLSLPPVMALYADEDAWRLRDLPWKAALRIEPDEDYLRRELWEYRVAELVSEHVAPGDLVLDLVSSPQAYTDAIITPPWHSAAGDRMAYALQVSVVVQEGVFTTYECEWEEEMLTGLRFQQTGSGDGWWGINDVRLFRDGTGVKPAANWQLTAWPNIWEASFAFDRNLMTRWGTWEALTPEMYLGVEFPAQRLTSAKVTVLTHEQRGELQAYGRDTGGEWRMLVHDPEARRRPALNLRRSAMRLVKRNGFQWVLAPVREDGYGPVGEVLAERPSDWGAELVGSVDNVHLFRIR